MNVKHIVAAAFALTAASAAFADQNMTRAEAEKNRTDVVTSKHHFGGNRSVLTTDPTYIHG